MRRALAVVLLVLGAIIVYLALTGRVGSALAALTAPDIVRVGG